MTATQPAMRAKPVPKRATTEIIRTHLLEHPAVKAWGRLLPGQVEPESVEILREKKETAIYRLEGVGLAGSTVIAKRCPQVGAVIEQTIYKEILPHLSITGIHYYGFVGEPDNKFCWLFLEDAGEETYSPYIEEHRALAAQWLGLMHTSAAHVAAAGHLSGRGPGHYLEHLQSGRAKILRSLANRALKVDDLVVLESIVSQCEILESYWSQVERFCEGLPQTLVHGDFTGKNLRVRTGRAGITLLAFDWEMAGWGIPAADLAQSAQLRTGGFSANPSILTYWSAVQDHWPSLDLPTIQRLANCGKAFRCLAAINWKAERLMEEGADWVLSEMRIYQAELSDAIRAAPWR
jgi:Phosphotransferase enzyme family